ncbi:MAG: helix-turn-helix domain-containing protein [Terrimicrobiaceae bacterium]
MSTTPQKFGEFAKDRRIAASQTLRSFCRDAAIDPSNWSKIERGVLPPPDEAGFLTRVSDVLRLTPEERQTLVDLAAIARGHIPEDLRDEEILNKMPAFFRAIRGQEYTPEDFEKLLSGVKRLHQP